VKPNNLKWRIIFRQRAPAIGKALGILAVNFAMTAISENIHQVHAVFAWESPLATIRDSLGGPVATTMTVLAICGSGISLAFGESHGIAKKCLQIVFGGAVAMNATSLVSGWFGQ